MHSLNFTGLGTQWTILIDHPHELPKYLHDDVQSLITSFESQYSRFKPDSEISKLKTTSSPYPLSPELEELLTLGLKLQNLTLGHFNLNIENLITGLGYDSSYSFTPNSDLLKKPLSSYTINSHQLIFESHLSLDLGSLGKGYLIDKISSYLLEKEFNHFLIDGGGDIFATNKSDHSPWKIAVEHPLDPEKALAMVSLQNQAIATSAPNKRRFKDFHHLLNPITKRPSLRLLSVSVLSSKAFISDALATALFVSPPAIWQHLVQEFSLDYFLVYPDFRVEKTNAFTSL